MQCMTKHLEPRAAATAAAAPDAAAERCERRRVEAAARADARGAALAHLVRYDTHSVPFHSIPRGADPTRRTFHSIPWHSITRAPASGGAGMKGSNATAHMMPRDVMRCYVYTRTHRRRSEQEVECRGIRCHVMYMVLGDVI